MRYTSNSWLSKEYVNMFKDLTGVDKLEKDEEKFIVNFFDISLDSSAKK